MSTDTRAAARAGAAPPRTTLALKEWGAAVHALLQGRQAVLLRKGGIHEKAFTTPDRARSAGGPPVLLFPTVAHTHAERTRPEHHDLLPLGDADVTDDAVTLRAAVSILDVVPVADPGRLAELEDLHIWTDASVQADRVDFRPRHQLQVLVVQAVALDEAVRLPRLEAYGGCRSWIDVDVPALADPGIGVLGTTALDRDVLQVVSERVRRTVG